MESCTINENLMHYYGITYESMHMWSYASTNFCIIDSVNKYQIGDTLKFTVK